MLSPYDLLYIQYRIIHREMPWTFSLLKYNFKYTRVFGAAWRKGFYFVRTLPVT